ncbi:MAG TPA: nuclear transport factor 2 family protein, partial [Myxococcota bacterium]
AKRFIEYASAFEQTFDDDDWTRLEAYFTADAVYAVTAGALLGGRWEGRAQVIEHLRESVNRIDRKFDERRVEVQGAPILGENSFEIGWRGSYKKAGCPDLVFEGTERATFAGDRIALLEDTLEEGADERIRSYLAQHFG